MPDTSKKLVDVVVSPIGGTEHLTVPAIFVRRNLPEMTGPLADLLRHGINGRLFSPIRVNGKEFAWLKERVVL